MKTKRLYAATIITAALSLSSFAVAQTVPPKPADSPPVSKQADGNADGVKNSGTDIDSFFKEGVSQTKKAQENGNSNCVPKPPLEKSTKPIS